MGGKAFTKILPLTIFPRLPPSTYNLLKDRLIPRMQALYAHVAVPFEAPEKADHGDIDFVVAGNTEVAHDDVKRALGATHAMPAPANRTSNYAVPLSSEDFGGEGEAMRYCQVDVHVCEDEEEWERIVFFHGYGDLGIVLSVIAKNNGLHLGTKGLSIQDPYLPTFHISHHLPSILTFLGLSRDVWAAGFPTQIAAFEWAATSHLFKTGRPFSRRRSPEHEDATKCRIKQDRTMYWRFVEWSAGHEASRHRIREEEEAPAESARDRALDFFSRREAYNASFLHPPQSPLGVPRGSKADFDGNKVGKWTGLTGRWREVKWIMDATRTKLGGHAACVELSHREGPQALMLVVLEAAAQLGISVDPPL